ncbi:YeeE/YedE thiosulfate transporter family protein [Crassaminicella indica]
MSNEMARLIERRNRTKKTKKTQIFLGIFFLFCAIILCAELWQKEYRLAVCWIFGIGIGVVLRYSRFCFASAFRDPFLTGNTRLLRGMLLAMMVSTIGFAVIQYNYIQKNTIEYDLIPGAVSSVGIHVIIGAFLFGVGMVIAGGCSSGVLMRIGEGHALQWIVLFGFLIGTVLGAKHYDFWYQHIIYNAKTIYFLEYFDFKIVVLVQLMVLFGLYVLAIWYENKYRKDI